MFLLIPALLVACFVALHLILRPRPTQHPFTIAHRGAGGLAPENTLAGIRQAITFGAAFTEVDIRRASDGGLVVMHDRDLSRTTGQAGYVEDLSSEEITRLRVKNRMQATHSDEHVPSLDAVLELVAGQAIQLVIEVKEPALYAGLELPLAASLQRTGMQAKALVGSFDQAWLRRFHAAAPDVAIMPIANWFSRVEATPMTHMVAVDWRSVLLDPTFVRRMRRQGFRVEVWTVDGIFMMKLMFWLGVDGLTTNRPDLCQRVVNPP
jgi:glycerophosphoryl diester phosphodiesterase